MQVLIQIMCLHGNQFSGHYRQVGCYREVAAKTGLTVFQTQIVTVRLEDDFRFGTTIELSL